MANRVLIGAGYTHHNFWVCYQEEGKEGYFEVGYRSLRYPDVISAIAAFLRGEYDHIEGTQVPINYRNIDKWRDSFSSEEQSWLISK